MVGVRVENAGGLGLVGGGAAWGGGGGRRARSWLAALMSLPPSPLQGTAFSYSERERLKLRGLLPTKTLSLDRQARGKWGGPVVWARRAVAHPSQPFPAPPPQHANHAGLSLFYHSGGSVHG